MARIVILGGTGYAGGHLAQEAAGRGHDVLAISRTSPEQVPAGVTHRAGDVREETFLAEALEGVDVAVSALSPRGDMADLDAFRALIGTVARLSRERGVRLGVIGGAGSLLVAEGGPKLVDTPEIGRASCRERV